MSSGHILIRMPSALHERLLALAQQQGVSLNQLCVALLAGATNFDLRQEES